eukprot:366381-Chlamydomonas_euryale.AAC.6
MRVFVCQGCKSFTCMQPKQEPAMSHAQPPLHSRVKHRFFAPRRCWHQTRHSAPVPDAAFGPRPKRTLNPVPNVH